MDRHDVRAGLLRPRVGPLLPLRTFGQPALRYAQPHGGVHHARPPGCDLVRVVLYGNLLFPSPRSAVPRGPDRGRGHDVDHRRRRDARPPRRRLGRDLGQGALLLRPHAPPGPLLQHGQQRHPEQQRQEHPLRRRTRPVVAGDVHGRRLRLRHPFGAFRTAENRRPGRRIGEHRDRPQPFARRRCDLCRDLRRSLPDRHADAPCGTHPEPAAGVQRAERRRRMALRGDGAGEFPGLPPR